MNILNSRPLTISLLLCILFFSKLSYAQTVVTGDVSGTWDNAGSPYLLIEDCTVPTGDSLIIEPGVEIGFSESVSLDVYGQISAIGTSDRNIIFKTINDTVKFNYVRVFNGSSSPPISEFNYCKFMNAQKGLYIHAYGRIINSYTTLHTNVSNCFFDSTVTTAIFVRAQAKDYSQGLSAWRGHAMVNPVINGCIFNGNEVGVDMHIEGEGSAYYSIGNTKAYIQNCIFKNVKGTAIRMLPKSLNSGTPCIINNTVVNCERGIWIQDADFEATIINNIFYGIDTVVVRTSSNSSVVFYNCFYNNGQNFVGYPETFGDVIMVNRNKDSCDIGQNIFLDPSLLDSNSYILSYTSPCLNAGKDSIENNGVWYYSPSTDIDGNIRPNPSGTHVDIGASERKNPCSVTNLDKAICAGDSIKEGGNWYTNTGIYTIILEDINECDSIINLDLTVNPLPKVNLGKDTTITESQEITLNAGEGFESYYWNTENTNQIILVSDLSSGKYEYSVLITDENECSNSDTIVITVMAPNAITNVLENKSISVYPNPANEVVYIRSDINIDSRFSIAIYDGSGKLIINKELENIKAECSYEIDISILNTGVYIMKLNEKGSIKIQKVIKE
jgi:parallel beta-helix repeat protein